jgi:hypothetical protein
MGNGSIIANLTVKATDAAGNIYLNEYVAKTLPILAAAPNVSRYTQLIPTTSGGTALDIGAVSTNGVRWLQNLDAANFIDVGIKQGGVFYPSIRLLAGEAWPIRVTPGITLYALADTASVVLKCPMMDA